MGLDEVLDVMGHAAKLGFLKVTPAFSNALGNRLRCCACDPFVRSIASNCVAESTDAVPRRGGEVVRLLSNCGSGRGWRESNSCTCSR